MATNKMQIERLIRFNLENNEDEAKGILKGLASVFNEPVMEYGYPTIVKPGSFKKTLKKKRTIPILWMHDVSMPIGKITKAEETDRGLEIEVQLSDVPNARSAYTLLKDDVIDGFSIGFIVNKDKMEKDDDGELTRIITEIDLWEVSVVTFPKDPGARVEKVRTEDLSMRLSALEQVVGELREQVAGLVARENYEPEQAELSVVTGESKEEPKEEKEEHSEVIVEETKQAELEAIASRLSDTIKNFESFQRDFVLDKLK